MTLLGFIHESAGSTSESKRSMFHSGYPSTKITDNTLVLYSWRSLSNEVLNEVLTTFSSDFKRSCNAITVALSLLFWLILVAQSTFLHQITWSFAHCCLSVLATHELTTSFTHYNSVAKSIIGCKMLWDIAKGE